MSELPPLRVLFFGTPEFAAVGLRALLGSPRYRVVAVVTQPDRPAGRGNLPQISPVKRLALEHNIPVLQPVKLRAELPACIERLAPLAPIDIGVVIAFGQILPVPILELPRAGCINVHASLLPRWRGAAPIQRALMAGDAESGVCLMAMEAGLDTGAVFATSRVKISARDTAGSLHDALADAGARLLASELERIARGELMAVAQPSEGITYADKILNDEARIEWTLDAASIARKIRALSPFPGAFATIGGKRLKLYMASAVEHPARSGAPGEVIVAERGLLQIHCGSGAVALEELQLEGKKRLPTAEFLKGGGLTVGSTLC